MTPSGIEPATLRQCLNQLHYACPKQYSRYTKCTLSCVPVKSDLPNVQSFYELRTKSAYNVGANQTECILLVHVECTKTCWLLSVIKGGQTPVIERFKVALLSWVPIIPRAWKLFRDFLCASDGGLIVISYCDEGLLPQSIKTLQHLQGTNNPIGLFDP